MIREPMAPTRSARARCGRLPTAALLALVAPWLCACSEPVHRATASGSNAAAAELGTGSANLGVELVDEGRSEGPRSLAVSEDGRQVFVLDSVNHRIATFDDGKLSGHIPVPADAEIEDLGLLPNGNLVLMEQTGDGRLIVIDRNGQVLSQTVIDGVGVSEPSLAGNLLVRADGVWVPYRNQYTRLTDAAGKTDPKRPILPSLPTRDGQFLASVTVQGLSATVIVRERRGVPKNRIKTLQFEHPIVQVLAFDTDDTGRLWLVTFHDWGIGDQEQSETLLTVLTPTLEEEKHLTLPSPSGDLYVSRYMSVSGAGALYYLELSTQRVNVRRFQ